MQPGTPEGSETEKTEESPLSHWMTILDSGEGLSGIKQT